MRVASMMAAALLSLIPAAAAAEPGPYANAWSGAGFSTFTHVLEAAPGRRTVTLSATTDAGGGQTVAVYPQTASGERGKARLMFVIATRQGRTVSQPVTFPQPPRGQTTAKLPVMVIVENHSGRPNAGEYTLTVDP